MTYIVTIRQGHLFLNIPSQCRVDLYHVNKNEKKALGMTGSLKDKQAILKRIDKKQSEIEIDNQTLIIDVILVRKSEGKSKEDKKKAGYIVIHLNEYKQNQNVQLELELKDCIVSDASLEIQFQYKKIEDLFAMPSPETNQRQVNLVQHQDVKQNTNGQFKVLAQKVIELEEKVRAQQHTIKQLEEKLEQAKFDQQEEINKTKRIEEVYKKEKEVFDATTKDLKDQLIATKNQLTEIMDVLNQRGEASILQTIEDLISR